MGEGAKEREGKSRFPLFRLAILVLLPSDGEGSVLAAAIEEHRIARPTGSASSRGSTSGMTIRHLTPFLA
jgi:hypothetical protein